MKSTRYVDKQPYSTQYDSFDMEYRPTSVTHSIPSTEVGLAGTYNYVLTYNVDGSPDTTNLPDLGDLDSEVLTHGYNSLGQPTTLKTSIGDTTYVTDTAYTSFGELAATILRNNEGLVVDRVRTYEEDTRRLHQIWTSRQQAKKVTVADVRYEYEPAGDVTRISDAFAGDHQCFRTDHVHQLKEAWTPANGDCKADPALSGLAPGPAGYWQSYSYDTVGNRTEQVEHVTPAGKRTTTYTVPSGTHRLAETKTEDNTGVRTAAYTHDKRGNTLTRPTAGAGSQTLTWDDEGHLATSSDKTGTTSYIYSADGARLIRKDPGGKTLYLPGQELRIANGRAPTATRYYSHGGETVATRAGGKLTWLAGDHHGTAQVAIDAVSQAVSIRRQTPFGAIRASTGTWPTTMDKGFVGGTNDNTGLTHLGAREYDAGIGRFISVDPVMDDSNPQQMHGYSYASNSPATGSDPSGLMWDADGGGGGGGGGGAAPKPGDYASANAAEHWLESKRTTPPPRPKPRPRPKPKKENKSWWDSACDGASDLMGLHRGLGRGQSGTRREHRWCRGRRGMYSPYRRCWRGGVRRSWRSVSEGYRGRAQDVQARGRLRQRRTLVRIHSRRRHPRGYGGGAGKLAGASPGPLVTKRLVGAGKRAFLQSAGKLPSETAHSLRVRARFLRASAACSRMTGHFFKKQPISYGSRMAIDIGGSLLKGAKNVKNGLIPAALGAIFPSSPDSLGNLLQARRPAFNDSPCTGNVGAAIE